MEAIRYRDAAHERFYQEMMERCGPKADSYSRALLYLLGVLGGDQAALPGILWLAVIFRR